MKIKAFTLIECIIALFILGLASLLLCQGYTQLMRVTARTNTMNSSLGQQLMDAEGKSGTAIQVKPNYKSSPPNFIIKSSVTDKDYCCTATVGGKSHGKGSYGTWVGIYAVNGKQYDPEHPGKGTIDFTYTNGSSMSVEGKDGSDMRYAYFQ